MELTINFYPSNTVGQPVKFAFDDLSNSHTSAISTYLVSDQVGKDIQYIGETFTKPYQLKGSVEQLTDTNLTWIIEKFADLVFVGRELKIAEGRGNKRLITIIGREYIKTLHSFQEAKNATKLEIVLPEA